MAERNENALPPLTAVLSENEYAALKNQVAELRKEYRDARVACKSAHKLEALVARQVQDAAALKEADLRAQLERANAAMRDQLEKACRARKLFDREKRALQARADELAGQLEQAHQAHAAELQRLRECRQQELQQAQQEARRRQSELEAQQSQLSAEASQHESQLAQRHAAELAAAREEATRRLAEAAATQAAWQQRCGRAEAALAGTGIQLREARREAEELRGAAQLLQQRVEAAEAAARQRELDTQLAAGDLEGRLLELEEQLRSQAAAHADDVRRLGERRATELEQVQARFAQVVARKDDAILSLQQQLVAATAQLRQMEDLLAG